MKLKRNLIKNGRCETCNARLHRRNYSAVKCGNTVIIEAVCPDCGHKAVVNSQPSYRAMKRPKKASNQ